MGWKRNAALVAVGAVVLTAAVVIYRTETYEPLRHELVVEVLYDHVSGGRFRHGTTLHRWRPDKAPAQCTREQIAPPVRPSGPIAEILRGA